MSHTDFITPFTMEETVAWDYDRLPEYKISESQFTELLLKRWPHTEKPRKKQEAGVYHYYYDFRMSPEDHPWELDLLYSCFVTIRRANHEILASVGYIYRQCVPREVKVYLIAHCEIPLDTSEEEILKLVQGPVDENIFPRSDSPDAL
jgi:hypothetical protein